MCEDSAGITALPQSHPQGVLPPPLPFCPSTPWTPPKTKASLWSWPTGLLPTAFFACFLSTDPSFVVSSSPIQPPSRPDSWWLRAVPSPVLPRVLPQFPSLPWTDLDREERLPGAWPLGLWWGDKWRFNCIPAPADLGGFHRASVDEMLSSVKMGKITTPWGYQADSMSTEHRAPAYRRMEEAACNSSSPFQHCSLGS